MFKIKQRGYHFATINILFFVFMPLMGFNQDTFLLREAVEAHLRLTNDNFQVAHIAELHNDTCSISIFWPCFMENQLVDGDLMGLAFEKRGDQWFPYDIFFLKEQSDKIEHLKKTFFDHENSLARNQSQHEDSIMFWMKHLILKVNDAIIKEETEKATEYIEILSGMFGMRYLLEDRQFTDIFLKGTENISLSEENGKLLKLQIFHTNSIDELSVVLKKSSDKSFLDVVH
ncbi:MAG: hypothetical protein MRY83_22785 [Flavobacteriales bacterium]|nr:hypothetical protein [Flavobacteriales bacterium]